MRKITGAIATLLVAFAASAEERGTESLELLFNELGRLFEVTMDNVAEEVGDAADRFEPAEPLDGTLSLTFEVSNHDAVRILSATSQFSVESEESYTSTGADENEAKGEESHSRLEMMGTIDETPEDGVYLIQYWGEFESMHHFSGEEHAEEKEEDHTGRLNFEGSAKFELGDERVLAQRGEYEVVLVLEEAE